MRKGALCGLAILIAALGFTGCGNLFGGEGSKSDKDKNNEDTTDVPIETSFNVSFTGDSSSGAQANGRQIVTESLTSTAYFKENRKEASRGSLAATYTPKNFVLDLDKLVIYKKSEAGFETVELLPYRTQPNGYIIPRHVDLKNNTGFIRDAAITGEQWAGIALQFLPNVGFSGGDMYVKSVVGVPMGAEYNGIMLPGELTGTEYTEVGIHWFAFDTLQPYQCTFLSYLVIGSDIASPGIQNPQGSTQSWDVGPLGSTSGNATAIFLPSGGIDFSAYTDPELVFSYAMEDLIEVYDNNTPSDPMDDIVTLKLSNPFPIALAQREQSDNSSGSGGDSAPPGEVLFPAVCGSGNNTIQWINPQDSDFDKVVIVRKENAAPQGVADGSTVYSGHEPNFCDSSGISGTDYHYRLFTVDFAGNHSTGVVVHKAY